MLNMREISEGIFQFSSGEIYRDEEWIKAWYANEKRTYYKCQMLNGGWCYKYYKPSIAKLILERGGYKQIIKA